MLPSKRATLLVSCLLICAVSACAQEPGFALRNGDRVVFFGDSITEQRLYTSYVQQFVLSRYPALNVTFINSGWSGDKVSGNDCVPCAGVGALARIQRDVIAHRPTVVTLLFGMNDGLYRDYDQAVMKIYIDGLAEIIRIIKKETHASIYVMTPTVYDGSRHTSWSHTDKYNEVLDKYSDAAKEIAKRENLPVIDLHTATGNALNAAKRLHADYTFEDDGVHPGPDGQVVMAAEILRAWGAPVSGAVVTQTAVLKNVTANLSVLAPLPWPAPVTSERIRQAAPLFAQVGAVKLKVTGLPPGIYRIVVDAMPGDSYSAAQLAQGIPLGTLSEKAQKASADLAKAVRDKEDIEFMNWRDVQLRFAQFKMTGSAVPAIDSLAVEANEAARTKALPRKYEITLKTDFDGAGAIK